MNSWLAWLSNLQLFHYSLAVIFKQEKKESVHRSNKNRTKRDKSVSYNEALTSENSWINDSLPFSTVSNSFCRTPMNCNASTEIMLYQYIIYIASLAQKFKTRSVKTCTCSVRSSATTSWKPASLSIYMLGTKKFKETVSNDKARGEKKGGDLLHGMSIYLPICFNIM